MTEESGLLVGKSGLLVSKGGFTSFGMHIHNAVGRAPRWRGQRPRSTAWGRGELSLIRSMMKRMRATTSHVVMMFGVQLRGVSGARSAVSPTVVEDHDDVAAPPPHVPPDLVLLSRKEQALIVCYE